MKLRHKAEMKSLLAMSTKGIGAKKKQKEDAAALELAHQQQMKELEEKEQAEKNGEENVSGNSEDATKAAADGEDELSSHAASPSPASSSSAPRQPSRAQKKKAAAAEKEKARAAELREMTKDMKDLRGAEDKQIASHMTKGESSKKLRVCEMVSDGHCLYRALADQSHRHGLLRELPIDDNIPPFMALRQLAARYIDQHRSDFEAFMLTDNDDVMDDSAWKKYLSDLVSPDLAVWGGHNEVVALSKVLKRPIIIWSADGRMEIGEEFGKTSNPSPVSSSSSPSASASSTSPSLDFEPLQISFHQHYYGLGAHYNSVITDEDAEEQFATEGEK